MAGFEVKREDSAGTITLRMHGTLDGHAARQVQLLLADVDPHAEVVMDFSQIREFPDYSVGVLTHVLSSRKAELRGLRSHQARMFQYLGVRVDGEERAYYTPEELLVA